MLKKYAVKMRFTDETLENEPDLVNALILDLRRAYGLSETANVEFAKISEPSYVDEETGEEYGGHCDFISKTTTCVISELREKEPNTPTP